MTKGSATSMPILRPYLYFLQLEKWLLGVQMDALRSRRRCQTAGASSASRWQPERGILCI